MKPSGTEARSTLSGLLYSLRRGPIIQSTLIVAGLTGIVKVGGVVKELFVTRYFGLSTELDAFNMALALPMFLVTVFAGPFQSVLVPAYIQEKRETGRVTASRLLGAVFVRSVLVFTLLTVALLLVSPRLLPWIAIGFDAPKLSLTQRLFWIVSPVFVLSAGVFVFTAALNAERVFAYPAITPLVSPILIILSLAVFGRRVEVLAGGVVIGLTAEMALLALRVKMQGNLLLWGNASGISQYPLLIEQYRLLVGGALLMRATELVDAMMASTLPIGSLAALSVGTKFISFPLTLAVTGLGTTILPYASQLVADRKWQAIRQMLHRSLGVIFAMATPLVLVLFYFAKPLVRLFFYRGAFTLENVELLASVLSKFALQIPFYVGVVLMVRMFAAIQKNSVVLWISGLNLFCKVVFNYFFVQWWGVAGLAMSTSLVYLVAFVVLLFLFRRQMHRLAGV